MLDEHLGYLVDANKLARYRAAVAKAVRPGDVVVDLGCGSGVLGMMCLQAGASRVHAIDVSDMIDVARESFTRAGFGHRVNCVRGFSRDVELPEQVDLVICDQVGYFGFDAGVVQSLADARRRFLKPGGRVVPERIELCLAAVESVESARLAGAWGMPPVPEQFHWLRQRTVNTKHAVRLSPAELLGQAPPLGTIDLRQDVPDFLSWRADIFIARAGVLHGLAGWFECELADDVWMTNSPISAQAIQRPQAFLPIDEPVAVQEGDVVQTVVMTRPADQLLAWRVELPRQGLAFSHSTWQGEAIDSHTIAQHSPGHVPRLTASGEARRIVLEYCDGRRTLGEIRAAVLADHPNLLPTAEAISRFVATTLAKDAD